MNVPLALASTTDCRHAAKLRVIGAKFLRSLDALSLIDPLFAKWDVLDRPAMDSLPLAVARPRIATIVENNVIRNDFDQPEPSSGYSAIGVTDTAFPSRIVTLSVRGGGLVRDEMMLNVGDFLYPTDPLIVKYTPFREASGNRLGLLSRRFAGATGKSRSFLGAFIPVFRFPY